MHHELELILAALSAGQRVLYICADTNRARTVVSNAKWHPHFNDNDRFFVIAYIPGNERGILNQVRGRSFDVAIVDLNERPVGAVLIEEIYDAIGMSLSNSNNKALYIVPATRPST